MKPDELLSLSEALATDRLPEFIAQEEARGIRPVNRRTLDRAIAKVIRQPLSEDRTSRSRGRGSSTGKRTR